MIDMSKEAGSESSKCIVSLRAAAGTKLHPGDPEAHSALERLSGAAIPRSGSRRLPSYAVQWRARTIASVGEGGRIVRVSLGARKVDARS